MERLKAYRFARALKKIGPSAIATNDPETRSILKTAQLVRDMPRPEPDPEWAEAARARILNRTAARFSGTETPATRAPDRLQLLTIGLTRLLSAMTVVFVLILVGGAFSFVTDSALPGDLLYPVKIAMEDLRMLTASDAEDAFLQARFAGNRLTEIQLLVVQDRYEDVEIAVAAFEKDVDDAVIALAHIALSDSQATYPILRQVEQDMRAYSESLSELKSLVPAETQAALDRAVAAGLALSLATD